MKNRDLIAVLQRLPLNADVGIQATGMLAAREIYDVVFTHGIHGEFIVIKNWQGGLL
jgi:hypothetical protein